MDFTIPTPYWGWRTFMPTCKASIFMGENLNQWRKRLNKHFHVEPRGGRGPKKAKNRHVKCFFPGYPSARNRKNERKKLIMMTRREALKKAALATVAGATLSTLNRARAESQPVYDQAHGP